MRLSPRSDRRFVPTRTRVALACSLALSLAGQAARAQTNFTWNGPTATTVGSSGNAYWYVPGNWTTTGGATATTYPGQGGSGTTDIANLNDTATNRIITYDGNGAFPTGTAAAGASGYLGTLNITETSGANNELAFIGSMNASTSSNSAGAFALNTLQIAQNVNLGATNGTATIFVNAYGDPNSSANQMNGLGARQLTLRIGTGGTGTLTINSGGVLELLPGAYSVAGAGNGNVPSNITGNVVINSGGIFNSDRGTFTSTSGASQSQIGGNLTMVAGGTINLSAANSLGLAITASPTTDLRTYCTNLQIQGGTINQQTGGTSSAASTTLNGSSFYISGPASYLVNTTFFNPGTLIELITGNNQTFYSNVTLNNIATRNNGTGTQAVPIYALKTIGAATVTGTGASTVVTANSAGTMTIGQLQFGDAASYASTAVQLASNVTEKAGSLSPNRQQAGLSLNNTINVAGFTFDLTGVNQTSTNNNGVWSPTIFNASLTALNATSTSIVGTFNVTSSVAGGVVKATGFDFSGGGANGGVNVTNLAFDNATAQTNSVTLNATGGPGTANNLSGSTFTAATPISPTSTFLYSGAGTAASPATLTATNRAIGILQVTTGYLSVNPGSATVLTTGGAVSVTNAGKLDIAGTTAGALTLNAGNFTVDGTNGGATLALTLSGASGKDTITAAGSGQSFSLTNMTIAINGTPTGTSYQVFTGFSGTNTVDNVSFSNVPAGETASIDTTGLITFATAVPEPGTWVGGVLLLAALGAWGRRRYRLQATHSH